MTVFLVLKVVPYAVSNTALAPHCKSACSIIFRVFLHDLLWKQGPEGFKKRLDEFLTIASRHKIRPVFVLFDSGWDPHPI
jgi:hypothetical protein